MNNKNHMKEVADILGVVLDEEFEVRGKDDSVIRIKAMLTYGGFKILRSNTVSFSVDNSLDAYRLFDMLLCGEYGLYIKRNPWKPEYGYDYYYVKLTGDIVLTSWIDSTLDGTMYKIGNCYRTREEAEINMEKWKRFYESDDVLEVD